MMPRSGRETRRLMEKMGMRVDEIPSVSQVIIKTSTKEIVIEEPNVTLTRMQGQVIYQVMGGKASEKSVAQKETNILEEDVLLVAEQARVSPESARKALEETKGDLAQAIMLLAQRKTS